MTHAAGFSRSGGMSADVIQSMRARVAQCRRSAALINDEHAMQSLLSMANQIEQDMGRLLEEGAQRPKPQPPSGL